MKPLWDSHGLNGGNELGYSGSYANHLTTDLTSWTPPEPTGIFLKPVVKCI